MIGVILAAGVGSRLRPMTNNKPKCLVSVAGKPILQYQLDSYKKAGVKEVYIIVGYESSAIINYCKHIRDIKITIINNEEYEATNNMYSLYLARDYVKGKSFILNNADLAISVDLVNLMLSSKESDVVAADKGLYMEESMKLVVGSDGFITDISKKIEEKDSYGCSIDFYKFSEQSSNVFFGEIERIIDIENNRKDWTEVAMQRLFNQAKLKFNPLNIDGLSWVEIDNYADLAIADSLFSQTQKKISDYQTYCLDLDGTIYVGSNPIAEAVEAVNQLKSNGKTIRYISNNSSKNRYDYVNKLKEIGINADASEIKLSSDSAINYMHEASVKSVYVLGTKSLQEAVIDAGFELCSFKPDLVLVGYDTELNYSKLIAACRLINNGIDYIATHCDVYCPSEFGPIPDIGCLIDILAKTTGVKPYKIFGKPETDLIELIRREELVEKSEMLMVGDRIYTDIRMANNAGIDSLLVLSGETTRNAVEDSDIKPTYILNAFSLS